MLAVGAHCLALLFLYCTQVVTIISGVSEASVVYLALFSFNIFMLYFFALSHFFKLFYVVLKPCFKFLRNALHFLARVKRVH